MTTMTTMVAEHVPYLTATRPQLEEMKSLGWIVVDSITRGQLSFRVLLSWSGRGLILIIDMPGTSFNSLFPVLMVA